MRIPRAASVLALVLGLLFGLIYAGNASSAVLHKGSKGAKVCGLQWMLQGHKPSVYHGLRTYPVKRRLLKPNRCQFGKDTSRAVARAKLHLGYPKGHLKPTAGAEFVSILRGKKARPLGWVTRAAKRRAAQVKKRSAVPASLAARYINLARSKVGIRERPDGCNCGPGVDSFTAVTGTHGLAWCAAFLQYLRTKVGLRVVGFPAPAHVFTVVGWARSRGLLRTVPRPGMWVAFLDRLGHIGLVERVFRGGFVSIEGNASNQVLRRTHFTSRRPIAFIDQLRVRA